MNTTFLKLPISRSTTLQFIRRNIVLQPQSSVVHESGDTSDQSPNLLFISVPSQANISKLSTSSPHQLRDHQVFIHQDTSSFPSIDYIETSRILSLKKCNSAEIKIRALSFVNRVSSSPAVTAVVSKGWTQSDGHDVVPVEGSTCHIVAGDYGKIVSFVEEVKSIVSQRYSLKTIPIEMVMPARYHSVLTTNSYFKAFCSQKLTKQLHSLFLSH